MSARKSALKVSPPAFVEALVIVAINVPWIGGIANFVLTLVGFGIIVSLLLARLNRNSVA